MAGFISRCHYRTRSPHSRACVCQHISYFVSISLYFHGLSLSTRPGNGEREGGHINEILRMIVLYIKRWRPKQNKLPHTLFYNQFYKSKGEWIFSHVFHTTDLCGNGTQTSMHAPPSLKVLLWNINWAMHWYLIGGVLFSLLSLSLCLHGHGGLLEPTEKKKWKSMPEFNFNPRIKFLFVSQMLHC